MPTVDRLTSSTAGGVTGRSAGRVTGRSGGSARAGAADGFPRPSAVRGKFVVFAVLTVVGVAAGLPIWARLALLGVTAMIPVAVALHGGVTLLRVVFGPLAGMFRSGSRLVRRRPGYDSFAVRTRAGEFVRRTKSEP